MIVFGQWKKSGIKNERYRNGQVKSSHSFLDERQFGSSGESNIFQRMECQAVVDQNFETRIAL